MIHRKWVSRTAQLRAVTMACACVATMAGANTYPTRPIRVIVSFAPGGASDLLPRMLGQKRAEGWDTQQAQRWQFSGIRLARDSAAG